MRFILRSLIIFFAVMLVYAVQRVNVMKIGYDVEDLKREKRHLEQIHNSLLIERAALTSVERIEKIATSDLEMKRPADNQVVLVKEKHDTEKNFASAVVHVKNRNASSPVEVVKYFDWRL